MNQRIPSLQRDQAAENGVLNHTSPLLTPNQNIETEQALFALVIRWKCGAPNADQKFADACYAYATPFVKQFLTRERQELLQHVVTNMIEEFRTGLLLMASPALQLRASVSESIRRYREHSDLCPLSKQSEARVDRRRPPVRSPDDVIAYDVSQLSLHHALESLPPRLRRILGLKYGLDGGEPLSLEEIGATVAREEGREKALAFQGMQAQRSEALEILRKKLQPPEPVAQADHPSPQEWDAYFAQKNEEARCIANERSGRSLLQSHMESGLPLLSIEELYPHFEYIFSQPQLDIDLIEAFCLAGREPPHELIHRRLDEAIGARNAAGMYQLTLFCNRHSVPLTHMQRRQCAVCLLENDDYFYIAIDLYKDLELPPSTTKALETGGRILANETSFTGPHWARELRWFVEAFGWLGTYPGDAETWRKIFHRLQSVEQDSKDSCKNFDWKKKAALQCIECIIAFKGGESWRTKR